jgi:hypothetical protein
MRDEWFDFLPIFILFFFVCYPYEFVQISETSLGKLFAVFLILYYSSVDLVYGILVCAILVLYYHIEVSTSIWSIERSRIMQESMMNMMREMNETSTCGDKCGDKTKVESFVPESFVPESFVPGNPDIFRYDSVDPSRGNNYNETVLRGMSTKKELEQRMQTKGEPMYSSVHESQHDYVSVSNMNIPIVSSQPNDPRRGIDWIFESVRPY